MSLAIPSLFFLAKSSILSAAFFPSRAVSVEIVSRYKGFVSFCRGVLKDVTLAEDFFVC